MSERASLVERLEVCDATRRTRLLAQYVGLLMDPGNSKSVDLLRDVAKELDKNYDNICADTEALRKAAYLTGVVAREPEAATALRDAFQKVTEARKQVRGVHEAFRLARRGYISAQGRHSRINAAAADLAALKAGCPDLFAPEPLKHGPRIRLNPVTSAAPARPQHHRI